MPRKKVPQNSDFPYHISARCINRDWFRIPIRDVWLLFEARLYLCNQMFDLRIHSFVLMNNHFHLLVSTPKANLISAMTYLMGETAREITYLSGRINQTYGRRHNKTLIPTYHYFMNSYKYVYQNPVNAGLCSKVEDYPYSTLAGLLGLEKLNIPICEDTILFPGSTLDVSALEWLNRPSDTDDRAAIKRALERKTFDLPVCRRKKRPHRLENQLM
jgi:putative transposase